jgi:hypothetical protein
LTEPAKLAFGPVCAFTKNGFAEHDVAREEIIVLKWWRLIGDLDHLSLKADVILAGSPLVRARFLAIWQSNARIPCQRQSPPPGSPIRHR